MENTLAEPLSYSRIATYCECPKQFEFRYVRKIEPSPHWYYSYGRSVHAVLEKLITCHLGADGQLYADKNDLFPTSLEQMLHENWLSEGYTSQQEEEKKQREALKTLQGFFPVFRENWDTLLYTEHTVNTEFDGIPFTGIVDRIDRLDHEVIRIVDYKSWRPRDEAILRSHRFQVSLYAAALNKEKEFGQSRFVLETYYLRERLRVRTEERTECYMAKSREVLAEVAHRIIKGDFQGQVSSRCFACDYRARCATFRNHRSLEKAHSPAAV